MGKVKLFLTIIGIISFMMINIGNKTTIAEGELDFITIASTLQDENIMIREWSLHAREKMENLQSIEDVRNYIGEMKQRFPDWEWKMTTTKKHLEAVAVLKMEGKTESIKISTPIKGQVQTYVLYEAKGLGWNRKLQLELQQQMSDRISDIFRGNPIFFSCMKGEFNDKMNKTLSKRMEQVLNAFQAKEIEGLKEETFMSTSAYTSMFAGSVETNGNEMNLQIGMRNQGLGGETTLIVGTPIVTIEY